MDQELKKEYAYADAIDELLAKIKKDDSKKNARWIAKLLGIDPAALTRAKKRTVEAKKFGGRSREKLFSELINLADNAFQWHFDEKKDKIIVLPSIGNTIIGKSSDERYIYKVYYWRGEPMQIGVGIMIFQIEKKKWRTATLLIDNQYPDFVDDDPYVMNGYKIEEYEGNTYIDFIDTTNPLHRQLAIFYTHKSDIKNRTIVEGVFTTLTRRAHRPIAGVMIMSIMSIDEVERYSVAEKSDGNNHFDKRRKLLQEIHDVPHVIYNFIYHKRLETKGRNLISFKSLPNYTSWEHLKKYVGTYEGSYVRTNKNVLEFFLLQFHENGSAIIHFPHSIPGEIRYSALGYFKWVNRPKNLITASFDYNNEEDHWRFRFILDGEEENNCLYGIFAGTELMAGDPVSGRVCLKSIKRGKLVKSEELQNIDPISVYKNRLKQIKLFSNEYFSLLNENDDLKNFFFGEFKHNYTDISLNSYYEDNNFTSLQHDQIDSIVLKKSNSLFVYAGDYEVYSLYRTKVDSNYIYYILKQPIRIKNDRSVLLKIRDQQIITGTAIDNVPVLKINIDEEISKYSHLLFTVNQLSSTKIDHVYGVMTGVNIENNRSEATIAVLVGQYSIKEKQGDGKRRKINFDENRFEEYEVGKKEFFDLDLTDPTKLATFISGHSNRYISPPSEPNMLMQSRLAKYRLPYFKSACYLGLNYLKQSEDTNLSKDDKLTLFQSTKKECLKALEDAFQHGFCDPIPMQLNSLLDAPIPENDVDLLVKEILPAGAMCCFTKDILILCGTWNRSQVQKIYNIKRPDPTLDFEL